MAWERIKCRLGWHAWQTHQVIVLTEPVAGETSGNDVVLAWGQCRRCAHSQLIHILK